MDLNPYLHQVPHLGHDPGDRMKIPFNMFIFLIREKTFRVCLSGILCSDENQNTA